MHTHRKHTQIKHVCRLGLAFGPPVCNLWCRGTGLHFVFGSWWVSRRKGGSPTEKSAVSFEWELGSRLCIILNVILFYPFWRRKCFHLAVHFSCLKTETQNASQSSVTIIYGKAGKGLVTEAVLVYTFAFSLSHFRTLIPCLHLLPIRDWTSLALETLNTPIIWGEF